MTIRTAFFWIAAGCCVVAELAILRSLLFGRARDAERAPSANASVARTNRPTEIAWALLPAAGLLLVLYLTWRAVDVPAPPSSDASRIGATIGA
jgi:heme/copper-type cytochrome/quinol oxidase subunit 2